MIGNSTNFVLRNNILTSEGLISFYHLSFFITGVSYLYILFRYYILKKFNIGNDKLIYIFITALLFISVNPIIQPRYLFPFAIIFFYDKVELIRKDYFIYLILSIFISVIFYVIYGKIFNYFPDIREIFPLYGIFNIHEE